MLQIARMIYHYHKIRWQRWYQSYFLQYFSKLKLRRILRYAVKKIPYYADWNLAGFDALPIVDKTTILDNFKMLNCLALSYEDALIQAKKDNTHFTIRQSFGTSGTKGLYISSHTESIKALEILLKKMSLLSDSTCKVALFYFSHEPYFSDMHLTKRVEWHYLNLHQDFEKLCIELKTFSPDVLIAPVQTLSHLARLKRENKISLSLKKVFATAEVLTPAEEQNIRESFGLPIHQLYQCAEGWLGATCEYGTLHLNEHSFLIEKEWVDKDNLRFIPVITALDRFVQPLIRYRMEDILVEKNQPCLCGDPSLAIETISGRCEDILYFPKKFNHLMLIPIYPDTIYHVLDPLKGGIEKYQLFQYSPHHLVMKMQTQDFTRAIAWVEQKFLRLCEEFQVKKPTIRFMPLEIPPLNKMFRQTLRERPAVPF